MEPKYQEKINSMQKFVPFLSKLIENLKSTSGNEAKIVQMQLLYNLLICPDPSVTIDELDKCESALDGIFNAYKGVGCDDSNKNAYKHQTDAKNDNALPSPQNKIEADTKAEDSCITNGVAKVDYDDHDSIKMEITEGEEHFSNSIDEQWKENVEKVECNQLGDECLSNQSKMSVNSDGVLGTSIEHQTKLESCDDDDDPLENNFKSEHRIDDEIDWKTEDFDQQRADHESEKQNSHSDNENERTNYETESEDATAGANKSFANGSEEGRQQRTNTHLNLHEDDDDNFNEEENVELVDTPLDSSEMIVPDSADHEQNENDADSQNTFENDPDDEEEEDGEDEEYDEGENGSCKNSVSGNSEPDDNNSIGTTSNTDDGGDEQEKSFCTPEGTEVSMMGTDPISSSSAAAGADETKADPLNYDGSGDESKCVKQSPNGSDAPDSTAEGDCATDESDSAATESHCLTTKGDCASDEGDCATTKGDCATDKSDCAATESHCSTTKGDRASDEGDCDTTKSNCDTTKGNCSTTEGVCATIAISSTVKEANMEANNTAVIADKVNAVATPENNNVVTDKVALDSVNSLATTEKDDLVAEKVALESVNAVATTMNDAVVADQVALESVSADGTSENDAVIASNSVNAPATPEIDAMVSLNAVTDATMTDAAVDDDDVLLIESRASPICIDSDEGSHEVEDEKATNNQRMQLLRSKSNKVMCTHSVDTQLRTYARKSTAHAQQVPARIPQIKNVEPSFKYLKNPRQLVETIDLVDSSDDDNDKYAKKAKRNISNNNADDDDDVILVSGSPVNRTSLYPQQLHKSPLKYKSPVKPIKSTAQSNFLNAVNLQPRGTSTTSSSVPAAFKAQLSNKYVIIPNAFYGNPPSYTKPSTTNLSPKGKPLPIDSSNFNSSRVRYPTHKSNSIMYKETASFTKTSAVTKPNDPALERIHKAWLDNFLANFANPLQIASRSCFVLLQRVLKYRFFQRIKESRTNLNAVAQRLAERKDANEVPPSVDIQLLLDLRNVFLVNHCLTDVGRRFCEFASCQLFGKSVILTTDIQTGKVTSRTRTAVPAETAVKAAAFVAAAAKVAAASGCKSSATPSTWSLPAKHQFDNSSMTSGKYNSDVSINHRGYIIQERLKKTQQQPQQQQQQHRKLNLIDTRAATSSTPTVVDEASRGGEDEDDDVEYTPYKALAIANAADGTSDHHGDEETLTERKKSLRINRTKRIEKGFTYNEDHDDEEFEAIARKIERKKKEELQERELARFNNGRSTARKSTMGGGGPGPGLIVPPTSFRSRGGGSMSNGTSTAPVRKKLRLTEVENIGNDDDDLLTPTWVEAVDGEGENDDEMDDNDDNYADDDYVDDDDDYDNGQVYDCDSPILQPKTAPTPATLRRKTSTVTPTSITTTTTPPVLTKAPPFSRPEVITCDIDEDDLNDDDPFDDMMYPDPDPDAPKNTDRNMHLHNRNFEFCVHCRRRIPRIVHHYVNEHPGSEVYISRIRAKDLIRVLTTENIGKTYTYKNGQIQYEAHCIFCTKNCKFMLPYWFEHFTMHTGEYSYKCSGCDTLKPTRSLMSNHSANQCANKGATIRKFIFDTKSNQIEAKVCTLCNYVQMHRKNVVRHLRTQHEITTIEPEHIKTVVLMQTPASTSREQQPSAALLNCSSNSSSASAVLYNSATTASTTPASYDMYEMYDQSGSGSSWTSGKAVGEPINPASVYLNDVYDSHNPEYFYDDDGDAGDDLSFMICGMLDVATNDVNRTLDSNRLRSGGADVSAGQVVTNATTCDEDTL